jgi:hypothetical protein
MSSGYYDATGGLFLQAANVHLCNCVGPQGGRPRCPCLMRDLVIRNGRYIQPERDLGPVVSADKQEAQP